MAQVKFPHAPRLVRRRHRHCVSASNTLRVHCIKRCDGFNPPAHPHAVGHVIARPSWHDRAARSLTIATEEDLTGVLAFASTHACETRRPLRISITSSLDHPALSPREPAPPTKRLEPRQTRRHVTHIEYRRDALDRHWLIVNGGLTIAVAAISGNSRKVPSARACFASIMVPCIAARFSRFQSRWRSLLRPQRTRSLLATSQHQLPRFSTRAAVAALLQPRCSALRRMDGFSAKPTADRPTEFQSSVDRAHTSRGQMAPCRNFPMGRSDSPSRSPLSTEIGS